MEKAAKFRCSIKWIRCDILGPARIAWQAVKLAFAEIFEALTVSALLKYSLLAAMLARAIRAHE